MLCDLDAILHLGVEHFKFRGPIQVGLLNELEVAFTVVYDFDGNGFIGHRFFRGNLRLNLQTFECPEVVAGQRLWQRSHTDGNRIGFGRYIFAVKKGCSHVSCELESGQTDGPCLLRKQYDGPNIGNIVTASSYNLWFPARVSLSNDFFPETRHFRNDVFTDIQVARTVVNFEGGNDGLSDENVIVRDFDNTGQITQGVAAFYFFGIDIARNNPELNRFACQYA